MLNFYQVILNQEELVLDNNRKALCSGKIEILDPISNNFVDVYTYNPTTEEYTIATNPIYLNNQGRPQYSYFVKQLAYLRIYKYIGNLGDPMSDYDSINWEFVRDCFNGIEFNSEEEKETVYGIIDLKNANVSLGVIDVIGYWNKFDCEKRTYVWDEYCTQDDDGGYIIQSNDHDTGRWILKFDGEYLPSTYYGVYPASGNNIGHEENINYLLSYVQTVGTNEIPTAKGVWFVPGSYTTNTTFTTAKKILLDCDTTFNSNFYCASVDVVGTPTSAIGNFHVSDGNATVHSSWYKDVKAFFQSGAKRLIFDTTNHFTNTTFDQNITISDKIIEGTTSLGTINYNSHYLQVNNCEILGQKLWTKNDYVTFSNMDFKDIWFSISLVTDWDFLGHIIARTTNLCRLVLQNFDSAYVYMLALVANGNNELNLEGRKITQSFNLQAFDTIINGEFSGTVTLNKSGNLHIDGCKFEHLNLGSNLTQVVIDNSTIYFSNEPQIPLGYSLKMNNCKVEGADWTTRKFTFVARKCTFNININEVVDNTTSGIAIVFEDCTMTNIVLYTKYITMVNCLTNNCNIKLYPYLSSGTYYFKFSMRGNTFNNTSDIEITKLGNDELCKECIFDGVYINGNSFVNKGLSMRYWSDKEYNPANYDRFIKVGNLHTYEYSGNVGNCPKTKASELRVPYYSNWTSGVANNGLTYWFCTSQYDKVFPDLNSNSASVPLINTMDRDFVCSSTTADTTLKSCNIVFTYSHSTYAPTGNGSTFNIGACVWDNKPSDNTQIWYI